MGKNSFNKLAYLQLLTQSPRVVGLGYEEDFGPYRRTVQHALYVLQLLPRYHLDHLKK